MKCKFLKYKLWEVLFTTKIKEITKEDRTDRRYSYLLKSKFEKERRKVCALILLIQAENCWKIFTTHLWLKRPWTPVSTNLYMCLTVEIFGHHVSDTHLKGKFFRKSSQG